MFLSKIKIYIIGLLFCLSILSITAQTQILKDSTQTVKVTAQSKSKYSILIKGKVIDASTGKGINGAELSCGTFGEAISSESGDFTIKVPSASSVLTINAEGFQGKEIALKGRTDLNINLTSDRFISLYKEKNIPTGDKKALGFPYALSQTGNMTPATTTSIEEKLQTGLGDVRTILRSGTQLIGGNMFIRGLNSINGASQPLIIVDGIPYEELLGSQSINTGYFSSALANIHLEDIDKVTVIKDGYALYGVKGANGVIAITTKRATEMKSKIQASLGWGVTTTPSQIPMLGASDFRTYASEQIGGAGYTATQIRDLQYLNDDPKKTYYQTYHNNTNWQNQVYRNAMTQNYHFQVTGGDEVARYGVFLGYVGGEGVLKSTDYNRFTSRLNADVDLTKKLMFSLGLAYSRSERNLREDGLGSNYSPGYVALAKSPLLSPYLLDNQGNPLTALADADVFGISNPIAIINNGTGTNDLYHLSLYAKLKYALSKSLSLKGLFSYDLNKEKESYTIPAFGTVSDVIGGVAYANTLKARNDQYIGMYSEMSVNYDKEFAYSHHLNAAAGVRYQTNRAENLYGIGHNSADDKYVFLNNSLAGRYVYGGNNEWKWLSAYASVDYDYLEKYILSFNASVDGSSRAGANSRYGVFPSVGAGWLVSSEKFMAGAKWIDLFKIRASYGLAGNDDIGDYGSKMYFGATTYLNKIGLVIKSLKNDEMKWETTEKKNIGFDLAFFNERIAISGDFYLHNTRDLITYHPLSQVSGSSYVYMNGGSLQNKGAELSLGLRFIDSKNFKWSSRLSIAKNRNEITSLPLDFVYNDIVLTRVGEPVGVFYGYKTQGVFATENEASTASHSGGYLYTQLPNASYLKFHAGDVKYVDKDNNGIINENDRQVIGNPNPDFFGSFSTNFSYKGWSLDAMFSYCYGNDVYNYQRSQLESMTTFANQTVSVLNRWKADGQVTNVPRASYGDPVGNARFSDRWIEDGSYVKMKSLSLSWTSPKKLAFVDCLTVFATANNLFVLTRYLGADPEFSAFNGSLFQGIDTGLLPQSRSFMAGFKINL